MIVDFRYRKFGFGWSSMQDPAVDYPFRQGSAKTLQTAIANMNGSISHRLIGNVQLFVDLRPVDHMQWEGGEGSGRSLVGIRRMIEALEAGKAVEVVIDTTREQPLMDQYPGGSSRR